MFQDMLALGNGGGGTEFDFSNETLITKKDNSVNNSVYTFTEAYDRCIVICVKYGADDQGGIQITCTDCNLSSSSEALKGQYGTYSYTGHCNAFVVTDVKVGSTIKFTTLRNSTNVGYMIYNLA